MRGLCVSKSKIINVDQNESGINFESLFQSEMVTSLFQEHRENIRIVNKTSTASFYIPCSTEVILKPSHVDMRNGSNLPP